MLAALLLAAISGCGSGKPAGSALTGPFAIGYLTVVSGETGGPVTAAEVTLDGHRFTTDDAGRVPIALDASGGVDVLAEGYLPCRTRLGSDTLTLWPVGPGRGPDYVHTIIYSSSAAGGALGHGPDQPLQRVESPRVAVTPSREIAGDAEAMAAHRLAIAQINDAAEGRVTFALGGSTADAAAFTTEIDRALSWPAATYKQLRGDRIMGGRIALGSIESARNARFLSHELGHALGLQHSASPADLMYFEARPGGATTFTAAERVTIRLLLLRRPGNQYPDDDRDGLATASRSIETVQVSPMGAASAESAEAHVAAARAAAGTEHLALLGLCEVSVPAPAASVSPAPPPENMDPSRRDDWHAEPLKVFDNLYFVGQRGYSAWAVTTSAGIILVDTLFDYSVQDEVVDGLKKLGLDPTTIKYAVVSHAHADHAGGARYLQERFGAQVVMSAADWDLLARDTGAWPKPKRDVVATDGKKLTLGDTTLRLYLTPGHTPGTISTLIPVKDHGEPHLAAEWGGTGFNFTVSADRPRRYWYETYSRSARRFREVVTAAGADVIVANHPELDGSVTKLPAVARRQAGDPNPYVVGNDSVRRYLTVADECSQAGLLRLR